MYRRDLAVVARSLFGGGTLLPLRWQSRSAGVGAGRSGRELVRIGMRLRAVTASDSKKWVSRLVGICPTMGVFQSTWMTLYGRPDKSTATKARLSSMGT